MIDQTFFNDLSAKAAVHCRLHSWITRKNCLNGIAKVEEELLSRYATNLNDNPKRKDQPAILENLGKLEDIKRKEK